MQETEIEVSSFEETNELLEKLGFSYRSYQEKRREKYEAAADMIIETDGKSAQKICEEMIQRLGER